MNTLSTPTAKALVTKAGLRFYTQDAMHLYSNCGFQTAKIWTRNEDGKYGFGYKVVGLKYFGNLDRAEVAMLKMRLYLTEQGIKYTLDGKHTIILVDDPALLSRIQADGVCA
jgi:hypothetical protein